MTVDNTNNALDLAQVQTLTRTLEPDLLESATLVNDSVFEEMYINVIRNLENVNNLMIFERHTGTTRRYEAGKPLNNNIGFMHERELKVVLSWNQIRDNIQNYREKEPFSVLGTNETFEAPNSEWFIRQVAEIYAGDVLANLFPGDVNAEGTYSLYDGFFTHIAHDINAGRISEKKHNLQVVEPIDGLDPVEDYNKFVGFINGLDPKLSRTEHIVYMSPTTRQRIVQGYLAKYQGLQTTDVIKPEFRFLDAPRTQIIAHPSFGDGDKMIATVKYNFEFGTDLGPNSKAFVKVTNDPQDLNVLIYQVQTAQGVRIRQISADKFCVSTGSTKPIESVGGEYRDASITVGANIAEGGTVTVTPEKDNYDKGDVVTLKAEAAEGYKFEKWSDNVTLDTRQISASGFPEVYQAVFTKEA